MKNWYQLKNTELGYWQRYIEDHGTSTSCILPWIHLASRSSGDVQLCSASSNPNPVNFVNATPMDAWNSDYMKSARTTMMEGQIPTSCTKCFDEEAKGIVSKRVQETSTWSRRGLSTINFIKETRKDGGVSEKIYYLDLRQDQGNNNWHNNPDFWRQINKQIPNLKEVYFTGNEPLMIDEYRQFIEEIVRNGYAREITLYYETDGLLVDNNLIELWKHFNKVKVSVGIDATGSRNNYICYPSDWKTIESTLDMLDTTPNNIQPFIKTSIQILNIKTLPELVNWKLSRNFKKVGTSITKNIHEGGLVNMHLQHIPDYLSIQVLPSDDKKEIEETFKKFKSYLYNWHTTSDDFWNNNPCGWERWKAVLAHMNAADQSHLLPNFKEYITELDINRGLQAKTIFPELGHLL